MLFFWTLNPHEYNSTTYRLNVTGNRTLTETERILNYSVGTLLIFCFLISTSLNPVLFYHHTSVQRQGITTFLFKTLAASDFLTNLLTPIVYSFYLFKPKIFSAVSPVIGTFCNISCTMGCFSVCSTTLLAITRFLRITNPFARLKKVIMIRFFLVYTFYMLVINCLLTLAFLNFLPNALINLFVTVCNLLNFTLIVLGVVFSIMTAVYVHFIKPTSQNDNVDKKVCGTILLMNLVYIITLSVSVIPFLSLLNLVTDIKFLTLNLKFISFFLMPLITSTWNPVVIITRSRAARETFSLIFRHIILQRSNVRDSSMM